MFGKKIDPDRARAEMVSNQLISRGIADQRVLTAMGKIPRHYFVDEDLVDSAYGDRPLPIGAGQTISQPYIVAFMTQVLQLPVDGQGVALEIGTGSGYQAAVLSQLASHVFSIERIAHLAERARQVLQRLNITNVTIKVDDGGYGWPEHSPYDGILVTAAAPELPRPLITQLKDGGRVLAPIGPRGHQVLLCLQRKGDRFVEERLAPVAFVPLLGEHGWQIDF
jgi:protein-L-isoaspartate(D-aspartate) O-methyltransferase